MTSPIRESRPPPIIKTIGTFRHFDKSSASAMDLFPGVILGESFLKTCPQFLRHLIDRSQARQLQRAQISDNRPAVLDGYVGTIGSHVVAAIGNNEKQFTIGHFNDPFVVK